MPDEIKEEKTKVEETKKDETKEEVVPPKTEEKKDVETKSDETAPPEGEENPAPTEEKEVASTEPQGNGIAIEDVATKDFVHEQIAAFSAKFEALAKENEDLKEKLSHANEETTNLKKKYEEGDFGNYGTKGVQSKDKSANDTFDEYSKKFM